MYPEAKKGRAQARNVVDLLQYQHEKVRRLFARLEQPRSLDDRQEVLEDLLCELALHETAEEEVVYPAVRTTVARGSALSQEHTEDQLQAAAALAEIEKLGVGHPDFDGRLGSLKRLWLAHAANEEAAVFPALRQSASQTQLLTMAVLVRAGEAVVSAGSRPARPSRSFDAPDVGSFLGMADRVRDAIRRVRRDAIRKARR